MASSDTIAAEEMAIDGGVSRTAIEARAGVVNPHEQGQRRGAVRDEAAEAATEQNPGSMAGLACFWMHAPRQSAEANLPTTPRSKQLQPTGQGPMLRRARFQEVLIDALAGRAVVSTGPN